MNLLHSNSENIVDFKNATLQYLSVALGANINLIRGRIGEKIFHLIKKCQRLSQSRISYST